MYYLMYLSCTLLIIYSSTGELSYITKPILKREIKNKIHFLLLNEFCELACQKYLYPDISISVYLTEN